MTPSARRRMREARAAAVAELLPRRLLLDTHAWLWWQSDDARLGERTRRAIAHATEVRLSVASVWEMAIKVSIGKLTLPMDADISGELEANGFLPLTVELAHADEVRRLALLHRDPFDRLLVVQTALEGFTLVSVDPNLAEYGVPVMDATT